MNIVDQASCSKADRSENCDKKGLAVFPEYHDWQFALKTLSLEHVTLFFGDLLFTWIVKTEFGVQGTCALGSPLSCQ